MLSAEPMLRLQAVVLQRDQSAVLEALGQLGVLQLAPTSIPPGSPLQPPPALHAEYNRWEGIRQRARDLRHGLQSLETSHEPRPCGPRCVAWGVWSGAKHRLAPSPGQTRSVLECGSAAPAELPLLSPSPQDQALNPPPPTALRFMAGEPGARSMDVSPEEQLAELDQQVTPLLRQRDGLARDWARIEEVRSRRNRFAGLPMDLDRPGRGGFLRVYVGYVPQRSLETLIQQLAPPTTLWHHPVQADRLAVVIATTSSRQAAVDQALREAGFEAETRLNQAGLPDDTPSRSNQGPSVDASPHRNLREEGLRLSRAFRQADDKIRFPLLRLEHQAETERLIVEARRLCPRTESTVLFTGWIPAAERPVVEGALTRITGGSLALEFSRPRRRRGETAPTLLRSPAWLRPFTPLVTGFGHPGYHEIVPTPFVALSYPLMFGAMFGDVGHGGILALAGMVFALTRKEARHRQAGWLLGIAGLSAVVFGWLYGSCFGLQAFKGHALWHDPLEADPARLMLGAVAIGVGLISLGLVLNIVNRLRRFDVTGALLDKFGLAGLLFYWGAIGLLAFPASPLAALSGSTLALVIAIPLVAWTLKGPIDHLLHRRSHPDEPGEDLGSVLAESAVGTFEGLLQFLANTVSFVRLAAYALSHAALLMATFSLAAQVGQSPVLGPAGAWAIIVLGNLITLVLEAIVASVQALRLEYYEFFGKFFAGDGRPFEPFRLRPVPLASNLPATS